MFITGEATFESFAVATVAVVAVEMFVSLLVLPAVLAWLGDRVEKGRIPFTQALRAPGGRVAGLERHRPRASCGGRSLSAVLGRGSWSPWRSRRSGMTTTQRGPDDLPQDLPIIRTYDRYTEAFPDKANVNEVVVKADDVRDGEVAAAIDDLVAKADESDTFIGPADITYSDDGTVA